MKRQDGLKRRRFGRDSRVDWHQPSRARLTWITVLAFAAIIAVSWYVNSVSPYAQP